jgi:hypothetical protein
VAASHVERAAYTATRAAEGNGNWSNLHGGGRQGVPEIKPGDVLGYFAAIDPLTGEKKWEVPLTDLPSSAGMLATGGGLVFTGKLTGESMAQHFEFIRDYAAVDLDEFLPVPSRGLEWGSHLAGTSAVFVDRHRPNIRMRDEINRSKRIWVQGITLKSFFSDQA